ncbi:MAG: hypothetical protein M3N26_02085 [Pseudomonadota bacterium]|nr:hypothetical protein [Pseudomonadota bacterium]
MADALLAGGPGSHIDTSDAEMKPRRSRKSKAQSTLNDSDADSAQTEESEAPAEAVAEPVAKPAAKRAASPRKTGRNREPEASAPPPLETIEPPASVETDAPAAQWHPETDTVTFDWFSIEQVAASDGPNQPMAKLLLAARAEGANSRWPF